MHPAITILIIFVSCCSNVVFLEYIIKDHPGCGHIITFSQFLFISIEGFIFTTKFCQVKPAIPIRNYNKMFFLYFIAKVLNNYALNFYIPMPLYMIIRSGSLIVTLILGILLLNKKYKFNKYFAVLIITSGIFICTVTSSQIVVSDVQKNENIFNDLFTWSTGIVMLLFALFVGAWMDLFLETLFQKFGKYPSEALFYSHVLSLPGFLILRKDIYQQAILFSESTPFQIPVLEISIPKMWLYLIGNIITQFICIQNIFILSTECSSLTVNLVATLRKFFSLLFSIFYFNTPFSFWHWIGTALVLIGTFIFIDFNNMVLECKNHKKLASYWEQI